MEEELSDTAKKLYKRDGYREGDGEISVESLLGLG